MDWGKSKVQNSHLQKAQNRVLVDMEARNKLSIFGPLRAKNAPKGVSK